MSLPTLGWLFALGVVLHNAEEAWLLPSWPHRPARWRVGARGFRFGTTALSMVVVLAAGLAASDPPDGFGIYLLAGIALAMVLNVLVPHVIACIATRHYAPGTATAVLLNLPLGGAYLHGAWTSGAIAPKVFAWSGPLVVLGMLVLVSALLAWGRRRDTAR